MASFFRVIDGLEPAGIEIEVTEIVLHEADEPNLVAHLFDADPLAGEHGAQVYFPAFVTDTATRRRLLCIVGRNRNKRRLLGLIDQ